MKRFRQNARSGLVGLLALVSGITGIGNNVSCAPGIFPEDTTTQPSDDHQGDSLPSLNPFGGATASLHEKDLQVLEERGTPFHYDFTVANFPFTFQSIEEAVVLPNVNGNSPVPKPAPFYVDAEASEVVGNTIKSVRLYVRDNDNPFTNGENFRVQVLLANNFGTNILYGFNAYYNEGHSEGFLTELIENNPPGEQPTEPGQPGTPGISCWDLNENGVVDLPDEDSNLDGVVDVNDCLPPSPHDLFDRSYAAINGEEPGTNNGFVVDGDNVARLYLHTALESLVGGPVETNLGDVYKLGEEDCIRVTNYGNTIRIGEETRGANVYAVYETPFTMKIEEGCEQDDIIEVKYGLDGFTRTINDSVFVEN